MHQHKNSLAHQREILTDTLSFHEALRSIPRENPDVVLVGEMRDLETMVLSQILLPTADGEGRVLAIEIMVPTMAIRHLIREGKVHEIYSALQAGRRLGMQTMSHALASLVRARKITPAEALARAPVPDELAALLGGSRAGGASSPDASGAALGVGQR